MASGFTTATRNAILTARFKTAAPVYGALCTSDPGDIGDLSVAEIAASFGYARTACTFATDAAAGSIANTTACEFPVANGGAFGLITHLAICTADVEAVEDAIANGSLTASKQIDDGDQLKFAIGNVTITIAAQA